MLVGLGLAVLATASAAEVAVLGVHDPLLDDAGEAAAVRVLADAVRAAGHQPVGPAGVSARLQGAELAVLRDALLVDARSALAEGRALVGRARPKEALPLVQRAVDGYLAAIDVAPAFGELWDAWLWLAAARLGGGDEAGAVVAVRAALALRHEALPDRAVYPVDVVALHAAEQAIVLEERTFVDLAPVGPTKVRAELDGEPIGVLPTRLRELDPGTHHVHARDAAGHAAYLRLPVPPRHPLSLTVTLGEPTLGAVPAEPAARAARTAALTRALARRADVPLVLIVGTVDGGRAVQLYDANADAFDTAVRVAGDDDAALAAAVGAALAVFPAFTVDAPLPVDPSHDSVLVDLLVVRELPVPVAAALDAPLPPAAPTVQRPRWPMWVGIAGGVVAAGLGVGLGVGLSDRAPTGTVTVGPPLR